MAKDWYKFIIRDNKREIICISHYAGKTVKGIAKCAPDDKFDIDFGRKLAQARCDKKIAAMRVRNAEGLEKLRATECTVAAHRYANAMKYVKDAKADYTKYVDQLNALMQQ